MLNTKDWAASENHQPPIDPDGVPLRVTGKVETTNSAIKPRLTRREPQGYVGSTLLLDLSLEDTGGIGTTDVNYRTAEYMQRVKAGDFTKVEIQHNGNSVAIVDIDQVS